VSRRPVVHQFTAVLAERDAVSAHVVAFRDLLLDMGCDPTIHAAHVHPARSGQAVDFRGECDDPAPDLLVYHASTGTPVGDHVLARPEPLAITYHNITPATFFDPWEPHIAAELDHGRRQLSRLANRARLGMADSTFNASELRELGLDDVVVSPILFDPTANVVEAPAPTLERVRDRTSGGATWLFVGRLAPNKAQHDIVGSFAAAADVSTHLVLVGASSSPSYEAALRALIDQLGLTDRVHLVGSVPDEELAAWYRTADVFVCLSDHEGFCVPLLEAMYHRLPIVAFDAGAVTETLGGAGLMLQDKSPATVAAAAERVIGDPRLRDALTAAGISRLAAFDLERTREGLRRHLAPLVGL
jgi:glycosyltransferase involved in cell wall biosynthesis